MGLHITHSLTLPFPRGWGMRLQPYTFIYGDPLQPSALSSKLVPSPSALSQSFSSRWFLVFPFSFGQLTYGANVEGSFLIHGQASLVGAS